MELTINSYPKCSKNGCDGTLVPIYERAIASDNEAKGTRNKETESLTWKCEKCDNQVK